MLEGENTLNIDMKVFVEGKIDGSLDGLSTQTAGS